MKRKAGSVRDGAGCPVLSLDGTWLIAMDPKNIGREQGWPRKPPAAGTRETRVPSVIQETFAATHGVAWYWRRFTVPVHPLARGRYLLRFHAVDYLAEVWVNGLSVGGHEGGETPFTLDVTDAVKKGTNSLAVRVLNPAAEPIDGMTLKQTPHRNKAIPFTPGSDANHGGIFLPVELLLVPAVRILDVHTVPDWRTGRVHVTVTVLNTLGSARSATVGVRVAPAQGGETLVLEQTSGSLPPGQSSVAVRLRVPDHRLWNLEDPCLYRITVTLTQGRDTDERSLRIGFRDFRVVRGFFRLNGKRILLKSTHTGNCTPGSLVIPPASAPDILRRDLLYAKAGGYTTVRFIAMLPHPWELDMCDELGLLVYEESYASWLLEDSPQMKRRFDASVREMVLRDRNHPSLVMYGLLNETRDGPVFRHAVEALPIVRALDKSRLVLLSSGRWDGQWAIGSVCNPGSRVWEHVWGAEAPGAAAVPAQWEFLRGAAYVEGAGDAHVYPVTPQRAESVRLLRSLGAGTKPVFLSEYGVGSMMDVIADARGFEEHGCAADLEDYRALRTMEDRLRQDLHRWDMEAIYPFAEDLLLDSQRRMARHRLSGFDMVRANPGICGFNVTGMLDHALSGEGFWRLWRTWKPGSMDALQNGWWPLRWCLFVDPWHVVTGTPFTVEAVLANEDVLPPGRYPVRLRLFGPKGTAWERETEAEVPAAVPGEDAPLAVPVLRETVTLDGPPGTWRLVADLERGGAPLNRSVEFFLSAPASLSRQVGAVAAWGLDERALAWLSGNGVRAQPWDGGRAGAPQVILVGKMSGVAPGSEDWRSLTHAVSAGSFAVFLSCEAFRKETDPSGEWDLGPLPVPGKPRFRLLNDWLYHKECVARQHPVFAGMQGGGILDWYYYGEMIPRFMVEGVDDAEEVVAAAFATGYCGGGSRGYESGILMSTHRHGNGAFLLSAFPVLEHLGRNPAADMMLLNLVAYAASRCASAPPAPGA